MVLATPSTTKMTSHGSNIYQTSLASSEETSMVITVPGMIMSLLTLEARRFTTGWKHTQVVPNDGSPTRAAMGDQSAGISTLDVSLVDMAMVHRFSWETIPELGSDDLPLLPIWDNDIKMEWDHTKVVPTTSNKIDLYSMNASITASMRCVPGLVPAKTFGGFLQTS